MAGMLTVVVFMGNVAGFICQFAFTMGLGSVGWFESNPGRLIAITFIFTLLAAICGVIGIKKCEAGLADKATLDVDEKEDVDNDNML